MEGIRITENDASLGPPRILMEQPKPMFVSSVSTPDKWPVYRILEVPESGVFFQQLEALRQRVEALERRTWWSMLVDSVKGWFR